MKVFERLKLTRFVFAIAVTLSPHISVAQDDFVCAPEEIEEALSDLECIAEGVFLSAESAVDALAERCSAAPSEKVCRKCLRKAQSRLNTALKSLRKLGLMDGAFIGAVKELISERAEDICNPEEEEELPGDDDSLAPPNNEDQNTPPPFPNFGDLPPPPAFLWEGQNNR